MGKSCTGGTLPKTSPCGVASSTNFQDHSWDYFLSDSLHWAVFPTGAEVFYLLCWEQALVCRRLPVVRAGDVAWW